jgi:8-oxo-dGTP pyrophosphatase MutT (NUDIX family)
LQLVPGRSRCRRIAECRLQIEPWQWPLATRHRADIARDWQRRRAACPALFDGAVYLFSTYAIDDAALSGTLFKTDFKTLLYWRSLPFAISDVVREASGASLIRSAEGYLLMGRQGPGQLNSGRIYPPSGVIDNDDVVGTAIDIDASIARELAEETGLTTNDLHRVPGYCVAIVDQHLTIGIEWRSSLPAEELRQRILQFIASQAAPELEDVVIVRPDTWRAIEEMPPHARVFAGAILSSEPKLK